MPYVDLPFDTFGDLREQGLEMRVTRPRGGRHSFIDSSAETISGRRVAGARFRCKATKTER